MRRMRRNRTARNQQSNFPNMVSGVAVTAAYKGLPHIWFQQPRDLPPFTFATIRAMLFDPGVRLNFRKRAAPIATAQFGVKVDDKTWKDGIKCQDPVIGKFIYDEIMYIWTNYLPAILRSQVWGWSAGEVTLRACEGLIRIKSMEPRHASDCKLVKLGHQRWGVQFERIEGSENIQLPVPRCWFHAYGAEDGEDYGISAAIGAYSPWADKWFNGGALDIRRLFMHKDAYAGADLGYPNGSSPVEGYASEVPNSEIAKAIITSILTGGPTTRPSERDENGNEKWPLTRAQVASNPTHILQYPKDCDKEIEQGMEVIDDSGETGAWAGKRVTMGSFYSSLDHWIVQICMDLCEQIIDPLCMMNFGKVPEYELRHKPLAQQAMEQQGNAAPGASAQDTQGAQPQQDAPEMPPMPMDQQPQPQAQPAQRMGIDFAAVGDGDSLMLQRAFANIINSHRGSNHASVW